MQLFTKLAYIWIADAGLTFMSIHRLNLNIEIDMVHLCQVIFMHKSDRIFPFDKTHHLFLKILC